MSSSIAGRRSRVKVVGDTSGAPSGAFNVVAGIKSYQQEIDGAVIDDSEFGDDWVQRIVGLSDGKVTLAGGLRLDDTNGQVALKAALIAGNFMWYQVLYDGTNGIQQRCVVTKFAVSTDVAGRDEVSIELQGSGVVSSVP